MHTEDSDDNELELSAKMSFLDHLDELRRRLIISIAAVGIGFVACFSFAERIYNFLSVPITQNLSGAKLVYTNPTDPFTIYMKVALLAGVFLAAPVILTQVWLFISPGLYAREKKFALPFVFSTTILFLLGGAFAYEIALPMSLRFLINLGSSFQPMVTITEYLDLILTVILGALFSFVQGYEYSHAHFAFKGSIYGATFFMATGFHGFHVFIGTIFLVVCLVRALRGHFSPKQHLGFEFAAWYWHFVDVVWLFLFVAIYLWGSNWGAAAGAAAAH